MINPSTLMKTGHLVYSDTGAQMLGHTKKIAKRKKMGTVFSCCHHVLAAPFSLFWDDDKQDEKVDNPSLSKYLWNTCFCYLFCISYLFLKTALIKLYYFHFTDEEIKV